MSCGSPGWVCAEAKPAVSILVGAVVERPCLRLKRCAQHLWFLRGAMVQGRLCGGIRGGACTEFYSQLKSNDWVAAACPGSQAPGGPLTTLQACVLALQAGSDYSMG